MAKKNLAYWLQWIKGYHDQSINYSLDNVAIVAQQLAVQKFAIPIITVAGTNGKGSCVATIEALLLAHGYKVAAYTSPHMFNFTERMRINGVAISEVALCAAMQIVHDCIAANNYFKLSLYEFATMAALVAFKQQTLDVIILEIGLGGRLDAANVVANDLAIITSISLDHCAYLGNTLEAIAAEKAGIIKANGQAIYAALDMPASVAQQARSQHANLVQLDQDYFYTEHATTWDWHNQTQQYSALTQPSFPLANAAAALQALSMLPGIKLKSNIVHKVFAQLQVIGRFQVEQLQGKEFIFDVAHNPAAVAWLVNKLKQRPCVGDCVAIVGIAATKDSASMLQVWDYPVLKWLVCAPQNMRRATPLDSLSATITATQSGEVEAVATVAQAWQLAHRQTKVNDRIIVFGSFHTVAEALDQFNKESKKC